ncbi:MULTISPECIES: ectoine synthase [Larsenimonas]|uniref:L-ectoine synthase n=1 Tax=Larsenimonas suaedae TaxID=1851019 RepID=A0ABU1GVJ5_9GAMM|nr:ectoine synthase [Larsenimonas suaedae]MCM2971345.1 ectoine synthase [Larsenimonas suaedae]MCM5703452.1 ectoine synthase [Larsenimonas salina]MDR5896056.1 ectoine synthase [Larsenimonas suaedae]
MIVRNLEQCRNSERFVEAENGNWDSTRLMLADDNCGFSFNITRIYPGTETHIHYKNHIEAVFCYEGEGEVETIADGKKYTIKAGDMYLLDQHDEHWLRGKEQGMTVACVFNPPLTGREIHRDDGSYAAPDA